MSATTTSDVFVPTFARLKREGRAALVVYVTAGHPDPDRSLELLRGLQASGADIVEVGVPFSDPMADGPVIQASSQRALAAGMTFDRTLALISRAALEIPVVLFGYLNPFLAAGGDALRRAHDAGARGILITDLPVGADPGVESWVGDGPLAFIRLVAPTTPPARMREIARHGSGFVYLISRLGVTGARDEVPTDLAVTAATLRAATSLPVCIGFGISRREQAAQVSTMADGVVVGSAVVREADSDIGRALALVRSLRDGMDARGSGAAH
ncbi:MAG: tryptophan synthase subunit alpha [Gemmatimonadaceae bacterium]